MGDFNNWKPGDRPGAARPPAPASPSAPAARGSSAPAAKPPSAVPAKSPSLAPARPPSVAPAKASPVPPTKANAVPAAKATPVPPAPPAHANQRPPAAPPKGTNQAGRVVHDARGNAVWDWFKETTRVAIDSTSRLLRKLEVPGLKVEETVDEELRLESDRDAGGGYDPYGSSTPAPRGPGRTATPTGRVGGTAGVNKNAGGGYDPYQKSTPIKPGRKS